MITLSATQCRQIIAYAEQASPAECCGLIGSPDNRAATIYPLRNVAANAHVAYEAAPEDLFSAQREMRERGEQLLAIYHSHPRSAIPEPSDTDVRLAYYPQAIYFILGLAGDEPKMRAFRIIEAAGTWEEVEYAIAGE